MAVSAWEDNNPKWKLKRANEEYFGMSPWIFYESENSMND